MFKFSFRTWLSLATLVLIVAILYATRSELVVVWEQFSRLNLWILVLFIPVILLSYYAAGEVIYSYLRAKKQIGDINPFTLIRMSIEMNFVNHTLPSGGASGISYMAWRLSKFGVPASRATSAQVVRIVTGFGAYLSLLAIAVLLVTIDGNISRWVILASSSLTSLLAAITIGGIYLIQNLRRVRKFASKITKTINFAVRRVTFGRKRALLRHDKVEEFLVDMHEDYLELRRDKRVLIKPFLWSVIFVLLEISQYMIVFWAMGEFVNPAPILIAYGVATIAGFAVVTPGGSGPYEALMAGILAISGISQGLAIAGVVLTRAFMLLTVIGVGYLFYQHAIVKYGKPKSKV